MLLYFKEMVSSFIAVTSLKANTQKRFLHVLTERNLKRIQKSFFLLIILALILKLANAGQMVWIGGTTELNHPGDYGIRGVPHENNIPSSRFGAVTWTDSHNNFYLFGGQGLSSSGVVGNNPFYHLFLIY